jgi:hypothetical protein
MKIHDVNLDAIEQGVRAFIASYPCDPAGATSVPGRAHAVLWEDDYWRGVTMAREVCAEVFQHDPREVSAVLDWELLARRQMLRVAVGDEDYTELDEEIADRLNGDEIDVLAAMLRNLIQTGNPDAGTARCASPPTRDLEDEHDELEEA